MAVIHELYGLSPGYKALYFKYSISSQLARTTAIQNEILLACTQHGNFALTSSSSIYFRLFKLFFKIIPQYYNDKPTI